MFLSNVMLVLSLFLVLAASSIGNVAGSSIDKLDKKKIRQMEIRVQELLQPHKHELQLKLKKKLLFIARKERELNLQEKLPAARSSFWKAKREERRERLRVWKERLMEEYRREVQVLEYRIILTLAKQVQLVASGSAEGNVRYLRG